MWEPHLVVRGCCVWHASVERVFGAGIWWCRGCVPPCVGAPVCGWCVSAVLTFSDTLPYCSPYCGALPSTSRVFGPLASSPLHASGLSLTSSHPPSHPIPVALWCQLCDLPSTAQVPSPTTHTHTPLSSLRAVTHLMCCFIPCWCVHVNGTVFCFFLLCFYFGLLPFPPCHPSVWQCCVLFLV